MIQYLATTSIGYSHIKNGIVCQDYSDSYHDDNRTIITACDGHGGKLYIRSDRGSKFASEAVLYAFKKANEEFLSNESRAENRLRLEILCKWNELVEQDCFKHPFLEEELSILDEDERSLILQEPQVAYGTTLNGAMIFGKRLICVSLGDGGCLLLKNGTAEKIFPEDEDNVANVTCSMCQTDAYKHLRLKILPLSKADGAMVFTDGFINPYRTFDNFCTSCVKPILENLKGGNKEKITDFVFKLSTEIGIGDDVSLGLLLKDEHQ